MLHGFGCDLMNGCQDVESNSSVSAEELAARAAVRAINEFEVSQTVSEASHDATTDAAWRMAQQLIDSGTPDAPLELTIYLP